MTLRFRFELTPLAEVAPWGGGKLHWFGLTDGRYWIELGGRELLMSEDAPRADYFVARFWEDLGLLAPAALEPAPPDLIGFLLGDLRLENDPEDSPECEAALTWRDDHWVDFGYLARPPHAVWWRIGDDLTLSWTEHDRPAVLWTIPAEEFTAALTRFDRELMAAMEDRVRRVEAGATPPGSAIDLDALRRDHGARTSWLRDVGSRVPATDWAAVRSGARRLMA